MDDYRITQTLLAKHQACAEDREWFAAAFPRGASWEELEKRLRAENRIILLIWGLWHVAPKAALEKAIADPDWRMREAAAQNPAAPPAALEKAIADEAWRVREAALGNPSMPPAALEKAIASPDVDMREAAARNPATPKAALERALTDDDPCVRAAARQWLYADGVEE